MRSRFRLSADHVAVITRRARRATGLARTLALGVIALCSVLAPARAQLPVYPHPSIALAQAFLASTGEPVDGVLAFATLPSPNADQIDIQPFGTCNSAVENTPVALSSRLTIQPPATSFPMFFSTRTTTESDANIHAQWALLMNPPGTTYVFDVVTECTLNDTPSTQRHIDRFTFKVVATLDSLRAVITAFFVHPSDTVPSLPLITSKQTSLDLLARVDVIQAKISAADIPGARSAIDAMTTQVQQAAAAGKVASDRNHPAAAILLLDLQYIRASL